MRGDTFVPILLGGDWGPVSTQIFSALGREHQPCCHGNSRPPAAPRLLPLFFPAINLQEGLFHSSLILVLQEDGRVHWCQQVPLVTGRKLMTVMPSKFWRVNKEITIFWRHGYPYANTGTIQCFQLLKYHGARYLYTAFMSFCIWQKYTWNEKIRKAFTE